MDEEPEDYAHRPYISCFAGIAITTCELVLWSSETWSTSWEVRNIIFAFKSNSSEVNNHDLVTHFAGLTTQYVVNLYIPVCNIIIMQIFHPMAYLNGNYSQNIPKIVCFVFATDVFHYFSILEITVVQLFPFHELS